MLNSREQDEGLARSIKWWESAELIEQAYQALLGRSASEIVNIWRTAAQLGDVQADDDFSLEYAVGSAILLLEARRPELHRAVHLLGARDSHRTVQDVSADELSAMLLREADREVEQLFIGLLANHDYEVRRRSFEALYQSLQTVPRPFADALELAQHIAPHAYQFGDS